MGNLFDIPAALAPAPVPVPKTIEWEQNGQTHKTQVYFKPLSWQAVFTAISEQEGGQSAPDAAIARNLAASLCDKDGQTLYTAAQIQGEGGKTLCTALITALMIAMNEVNNAGKT